MTTYTDPFTGVTGTPLTTYNANYAYINTSLTPNNFLQINTSAVCVAVNANSAFNGGVVLAYRSDQSFAQDHWIQGTIENATGTGPLYLTVRASTSNGNTGYGIFVQEGGPNPVHLYILQSGLNIVAYPNYTSTNGDVWTLSVKGSQVRAYLNGNCVIQVSNTSIPGFAGCTPAFGGQFNGSFVSYMRWTNITASDVFITPRIFANNTLGAYQFVEGTITPSVMMRLGSNANTYLTSMVETGTAHGPRIFANGTISASQFLEGLGN